MSSAAVGTAIDDADVQAVVRSGHGKLPRACFYLVQVRDVDAARAWLHDVAVATVGSREARTTNAIQVALTAPGMRALGIPASIVEAFSPEFVAGMSSDESRGRRLGDIGSNAPSKWQWGAGAKIPHIVMMLFGTQEGWTAAEMALTTGTWREAFTPIACLQAADLDNTEPFGFVDGISQPEIDWTENRAIRTEELEYTNLSALGEFVLGFRNEYGKFTDRPLLSAASGGNLPPAIDVPEMHDLGRHGTYLVIRELVQDVRGFWQYLYEQSRTTSGAIAVAEAMVGRRMNGDPLVPASTQPIASGGRTPFEAERNQFVFDGDPNGERCPLGAHIRRVNPRNSDFAGPATGPLLRLSHRLGFGTHGWRDDSISSTRFHRIVRRGRKFGPTFDPQLAMQPAPAGEPDRGLYFVCINANIARQFEFVQSAWVMSAGFNGLCGERDPLLGHRGDQGRESCDTFTIPRPGGASRRLYAMPQFVTVRGGAYFFLPGVQALRFLATVCDA
jgi:deferrochelatase/peroxidase EfeB